MVYLRFDTSPLPSKLIQYHSSILYLFWHRNIHVYNDFTINFNDIKLPVNKYD